MKKNPLVSIIVVTYNSQSYIEETLESVKNQTYSNIELVISDDFSTDRTVFFATKWIKENEKYFKNYKIIQSDKNTGISKNVNRGIKEANGEFIKLLAGDDILLGNCVEDSLNFILDNNLEFCFANAYPFADGCQPYEYENDEIEKIIHSEKNSFSSFFSKSHKEQYRLLLRLTIPLSMVIGGFYSKIIFSKVGVFDEKYEMMEDYPFLIKLSNSGYKFELLNKYTVKYRVRLGTESNIYKNSDYYTKFYNNLRDYRKETIIPLMRENNMYFSEIYLRIVMFLLHLEKNSENKTFNKLMNVLRNVKSVISTKS